MKFRAEIEVMPKKEILDPQGKAVMLGLNNLGLNNVEDVRIGKNVELILDADSKEEAEKEVDEACKKLLSNVIMETYEFKIFEV